MLVPSAILERGVVRAGVQRSRRRSSRPHARATASAILIFVINLIGPGLGPLAIGALNDALARLRTARSAIRYSLLIIAATNLWAAAHFFAGARTVRADVAAAELGHILTPNVIVLMLPFLRLRMASGIGITMARNEYEYMSAWNIIRCVSSCGLSRMGTPEQQREHRELAEERRGDQDHQVRIRDPAADPERQRAGVAKKRHLVDGE